MMGGRGGKMGARSGSEKRVCEKGGRGGGCEEGVAGRKGWLGGRGGNLVRWKTRRKGYYICVKKRVWRVKEGR